MCKRIPLSRGAHALVSDEDYERVRRHKWSLDGNGYAVRVPGPRRNRRKIMLHRFIMDAPKGMDVDHINHDLLDCRRNNLRIATRSQNNANTGPRAGSASQYKGVFCDQRDGTWYSSMTAYGLKLHIGRFADEADAARAYDRVAYLVWGEFAHLNFPDDLHDVSPDDVYPTLSQVSQARLKRALATQ